MANGTLASLETARTEENERKDHRLNFRQVEFEVPLRQPKKNIT